MGRTFEPAMLLYIFMTTFSSYEDALFPQMAQEKLRVSSKWSGNVWSIFISILPWKEKKIPKISEVLLGDADGAL